MNAPKPLTYSIVLASSSRYRQELLGKLGLPFHVASPAIDETAHSGESPVQLSKRLAQEKANALAEEFPRHLIIGSDQVAILEGAQLCKPCDPAQAVAQLLNSQGKSVEFFTSVCVLNSATGECVLDIDKTVVHFRQLTEKQIAFYVEKERPYDCAGGFKSESLGVALFDRLETSDPNALVGLPLIKLVGLLEKFGVDVLSSHTG